MIRTNIEKKMKQNKYDDDIFFEQYNQMSRSVKGLEGAGEWHILKNMLPDFTGKDVLDLGCGLGWHCFYAVQQGAKSALGIDLSEKMIAEAKRRNSSSLIKYRVSSIEDYEYPTNTYDVVISSLAFHYLKSFEEIALKVYKTLKEGGSFVFSVEHPIFTAYGNQDWYYDEDGQKLHWPVDRYFFEGERNAVFLGESVIKYHKTLTNYMKSLLKAGFEIIDVAESEPSKEMLESVPGMSDELRRPMFLLVSAVKK